VAEPSKDNFDAVTKSGTSWSYQIAHLLLADLAEPGLVNGNSRVQFVIGFRDSLCLFETSSREETREQCDRSCGCSSTGRVDFLGDKSVYWAYSKSMSN